MVQGSIPWICGSVVSFLVLTRSKQIYVKEVLRKNRNKMSLISTMTVFMHVIFYAGVTFAGAITLPT